jgi:hypothetical protein
VPAQQDAQAGGVHVRRLLEVELQPAGADVARGCQPRLEVPRVGQIDFAGDADADRERVRLDRAGEGDGQLERRRPEPRTRHSH